MVILSQFGQFLAIFQDFPNRSFSIVHGKVHMGSEKPSDIVAMLRHFFRVTAVKEGCAPAVTFFLVHGPNVSFKYQISNNKKKLLTQKIIILAAISDKY